MDYPFRKLTTDEIQRTVDLHIARIENASKGLLAFYADQQRQDRKRSNQCKYCYYYNNTRIGGAAITYSPCGICEKVMLFPSTSVDRICDECADKHALCARCGCDVNMKPRRKL